MSRIRKTIREIIREKIQAVYVGYSCLRLQIGSIDELSVTPEFEIRYNKKSLQEGHPREPSRNAPQKTRGAKERQKS